MYKVWIILQVNLLGINFVEETFFAIQEESKELTVIIWQSAGGRISSFSLRGCLSE